MDPLEMTIIIIHNLLFAFAQGIASWVVVSEMAGGMSAWHKFAV
jgi:hypothetical protein